MCEKFCVYAHLLPNGSWRQEGENLNKLARVIGQIVQNPRKVINAANPMMLEGEVQIDESLFGRKVKYHTGNPNRGLKVSVLSWCYIIKYLP